MPPIRPIILSLMLALPASAQETAIAATDDEAIVEAEEVMPTVPDPKPSLADFLWVKRPLVVFADSENDLLFRRQMELLEEEAAMLEERDVVVLIDTDPSAASDLRKQLRPRGFQLVIVGKDGGVKLRKPRPWTVREISRVIDKMPMRQQEIRQRWER